MTRALTVRQPGPLTTVQDEGRTGLGALGVPRSGACDRRSHRLANRLVGNRAEAATLEATLGGLVLAAGADLVLAVTGARAGDAVPHNAPFRLAAGHLLRLGTPARGLRTYVAVRGGFDVPPVMGSRSTDLLSGLGPPPLRAGDVLPVGPATAPMPGVDLAPVPELGTGHPTVTIHRGPRDDWFSGDAWATLTSATYTVGRDSNRVGLRLAGPGLTRSIGDELPSEAMVRGALQVPPDGRPILFLADHPVTGGYPVIGCVADEDVDLCGQLRPGDRVSFRPARAGQRR